MRIDPHAPVKALLAVFAIGGSVASWLIGQHFLAKYWDFPGEVAGATFAAIFFFPALALILAWARSDRDSAWAKDARESVAVLGSVAAGGLGAALAIYAAFRVVPSLPLVSQDAAWVASFLGAAVIGLAGFLGAGYLPPILERLRNARIARADAKWRRSAARVVSLHPALKLHWDGVFDGSFGSSDVRVQRTRAGVSIRMSCSTPPDFSLRAEPLGLKALLRRDDIQTGDGAFDAVVFIDVMDPVRALVLFDHETRELLLAEMRIMPSLRIEKGVLAIDGKALLADDPELLNVLLLRLAAVVTALASNAAVSNPVPRLSLLVRDPVAGVRRRALELLISASTKAELHPVLLEAVRDDDGWVRLLAARELDAEGAEALPPLLTDSDPGVRAGAAKQLGLLGNASAEGVLLAALADETDDAVLAALSGALGTLGTSRAVELLRLRLGGGAETDVRRIQERLGGAPGQLAIADGVHGIEGALSEAAASGALSTIAMGKKQAE